MPKTPKKKRSKPARSRLKRIAIIFAVISAAVVLCASLTFLVIDKRTVRILNARKASFEPAIYSDSRSIQKGQKFRADLLRSELGRRSYREVDGRPAAEGEFHLQDRTFWIYTRKFVAPNGETVDGVSARYNPATGELSRADGGELASFVLEPQVIADLESGDIRASRFVPLTKIPAPVKNAVIAIEDERFYHHFGIDVIGIARAVFADIKAMGLVQGGSTLTQQLAKNVFLSPRRTLGRKILELFTALSLEYHLSKDQILELYLNEVYLGQDGPVAIHGMAEAAHLFFNKDLTKLSTSDAALLAGIIKGPSIYSPRRHLDRAVERRNLVLENMHEQGFITTAALEKSRAEQPVISNAPPESRAAPHFTSALRQILNNEYKIDGDALSSLRVYTGLDYELQRCAEHAVTSGVEELERRVHGLQRKTHKLEAGLVAIEPFSGKVRAWAGGRNYSENQFDHVYLARRQIGSTIKPFVYLTALDGNLNQYKVATVTSILADEPLTIHIPGSGDWSPENYDRRFRGDVSLRYALENSLNVPTVYLAQRVGIEAVAQTVERFHVARQVPAVPSLVLGTAEATLFDLVAAYGALANGGVYVRPRPFLSALDRDAAQVASSQIGEERLADEGAVYVLTNIMQGVVERGTAARVRALGYKGDVAGKTGTTDSARDAWFVGFTPDLAAGVWVGFDDNRRVGLTGGVAAVPIWTEFMKCAAQFHDSLPFLPPPSVTFAKIDAQTGELATPECPADNVIDEVFVKGTEPVRYCALHGGDQERLDIEELRRERRPSQERRRPRSLWERIFG